MVFELAHQIGLVPILAMLVMGRKLPGMYWLVAVAFSVSWFADSLAHFSGGNWVAWHLLLPVQIWLVLLAFIDDRRAFAALALFMLAVLSWAWHGPGPDQLVITTGSIAILLVARGALAWPLYVYFGGGTVAYLVMTSGVGGAMLPAWYCYQSCRLLSFIFFIGIIAPPLIHRRKGEQCG